MKNDSAPTVGHTRKFITCLISHSARPGLSSFFPDTDGAAAASGASPMQRTRSFFFGFRLIESTFDAHDKAGEDRAESRHTSCDAQKCKATKKTHGGWLDRKMSSSQSDQQILPSSIHQRAAAFFFFFFFASFLHLPSPHPSSLRGAATLHPSLSCGTLFGLTPCHICQEQVAGGTDRWSENKCKSRRRRILRRKATVVFDPRPPRTPAGGELCFQTTRVRAWHSQRS